jgi:hypothetical protein
MPQPRATQHSSATQHERRRSNNEAGCFTAAICGRALIDTTINVECVANEFWNEEGITKTSHRINH